jgi:hypothetical protein
MGNGDGANGDDANGDDASQSGRFPARRCPKCRGHDIPCDLCHGTTPETRFVSHFKAAMWFVDHPEIKDTPSEFLSVRPPRDDDKEK